MDSQKYPIGIQAFSKIIEEGFVYVDKTAFIKSLLAQGGYFFLSRPRRFGKSLLLSTLHAFFEGRKDLFKGLAIENCDVDWTPSPVLHFDLNAEDYAQENGLVSILDMWLAKYERIYEVIPEEGDSLPKRFHNLILQAYNRSGRKVVILVDEYDKPLLGMEEDSTQFIRNQSLLKGFFGNLKTMDSFIRFAFITGVARFGKVSIFSDVNNLYDISLASEYSDICGWTEQELLSNFKSGIEKLAEERGETFEYTLNALREFYDGYLFTPKGNRLYNPFSVLLALQNREIEPYWFESGTPTFLARSLRERGVDVALLNGAIRNRESLISVAFPSDDVVPLMFQTGYLTIKSYEPRTRRFELRFPNREVEIGFARNLLPLYAPPTQNFDGPYNVLSFQDDLFDGRPIDFMERLGALLKAMPYEMHGENVYQSIVYLVCVLSGTEGIPEQHSYKGRCDLTVTTPEYIYIFEFKYNRTVEEAMAQLYDRDYAGRYALDKQTVYLIGANFSTDKADRGLTSYKIEKLSAGDACC